MYYVYSIYMYKYIIMTSLSVRGLIQNLKQAQATLYFTVDFPCINYFLYFTE